MEQVTVLIPNRDKAQLFVELLHSLDFIADIQQVSTEAKGQRTETGPGESFFSLAGLWSDRDISADSLRENAWPRR